MKNKLCLLSTGILLTATSCAALAAGPVGLMPYNGNGSGNSFTIDHATFDRDDVTAAPCPAGSVCTNMTATSTDDNLLMREVHDTLTDERFIQLIFSENDPSAGSFIYESAVSSQGSADSIGAKQVLDDPNDEFYASHAMYHGALFGDTAASGFPSLEMVQHVGGFQTFTFEAFDIMDPDYDETEDFYRDNFPYDARAQIIQNGAGNMPDFSHTILRGQFQTVNGFAFLGLGTPFEIDGQTLEFMQFGEVTATWIGASMSGGGPGVLPADGQTQNHDTRLASQRDFGLLIYRYFAGSGPTDGNAGGSPAGIPYPYFTQPLAMEIRGFSLQHDQNDSGLMYNTGHGAFVGGADLLENYWRDDVFGDHPF